MSELNNPPLTAKPFAAMTVTERLIYVLGVGLGSGLSPKAPGTAGSALVLLLVPLWVWLGFWPSLWIMLGMTLIGIPICGKTAQLMGVHDDGRIVWDEFAGQSITLLPLLYGGHLQGWTAHSLIGLLLAFALFRFFDVLKPWPIGYFDKHVHGGFGIMLDDVWAGIFAAGAVWVLLSTGVLGV